VTDHTVESGPVEGRGDHIKTIKDSVGSAGRRSPLPQAAGSICSASGPEASYAGGIGLAVALTAAPLTLLRRPASPETVRFE
jgi:hypothetical protein